MGPSTDLHTSLVTCPLFFYPYLRFQNKCLRTPRGVSGSLSLPSNYESWSSPPTSTTSTTTSTVTNTHVLPSSCETSPLISGPIRLLLTTSHPQPGPSRAWSCFQTVHESPHLTSLIRPLLPAHSTLIPILIRGPKVRCLLLSVSVLVVIKTYCSPFLFLPYFIILLNFLLRRTLSIIHGSRSLKT